MTVKFDMKGMKELDKQLKLLSKSSGKAVLRKSLKKAGQVIADSAQAKAPRKEGKLEASISVSTKLNKAQRKLERKQGSKSSVEMYVGSGARHAHLLEFGTVNMAAQPFMRPAFEETQQEVVDTLADELRTNMSKALKRAARRAARQ